MLKFVAAPNKIIRSITVKNPCKQQRPTICNGRLKYFDFYHKNGPQKMSWKYLKSTTMLCALHHFTSITKLSFLMSWFLFCKKLFSFFCAKSCNIPQLTLTHTETMMLCSNKMQRLQWRNLWDIYISFCFNLVKPCLTISFINLCHH